MRRRNNRRRLNDRMKRRRKDRSISEGEKIRNRLAKKRRRKFVESRAETFITTYDGFEFEVNLRPEGTLAVIKGIDINLRTHLELIDDEWVNEDMGVYTRTRDLDTAVYKLLKRIV